MSVTRVAREVGVSQQHLGRAINGYDSRRGSSHQLPREEEGRELLLTAARPRPQEHYGQPSQPRGQFTWAISGDCHVPQRNGPDHALLPAIPIGAKLQRVWEDADSNWRRALRRAVVDRIEVGPGRQGSHRFDPSRVRIVWRASL